MGSPELGPQGEPGLGQGFDVIRYVQPTGQYAEAITGLSHRLAKFASIEILPFEGNEFFEGGSVQNKRQRVVVAWDADLRLAAGIKGVNGSGRRAADREYGVLRDGVSYLASDLPELTKPLEVSLSHPISHKRSGETMRRRCRQVPDCYMVSAVMGLWDQVTLHEERQRVLGGYRYITGEREPLCDTDPVDNPGVMTIEIAHVVGVSAFSQAAARLIREFVAETLPAVVTLSPAYAKFKVDDGRVLVPFEV